MLNTHFSNLVRTYIPTIEQLTHCYAFTIPLENTNGNMGIDIELTNGNEVHELYSFYIDDGHVMMSAYDAIEEEGHEHRLNIMDDIRQSLDDKVNGRHDAVFARADYFERNGLTGNLDEEGWKQVDGLTFTKEVSEKPRVYFDMDGTLAVFNKNATMEEVFSPGYFRKLEPIKETVELAEELVERGYDVNILSGSCYTALQEKIEWLREHMPFITPDHYVFVPVDADKSRFIPDPKHSVLIDDYNKNLDAWKGLALKCKTDINNHNPKYISLEVGTDMLTVFEEAVKKMIPKDHITLSDYLKLSQGEDNIPRPLVRCNDGFSLYISAGQNARSEPDVELSDTTRYEEVEVSYPSEADPVLKKFADEYLYLTGDLTDSVFPYMPVELVEEMLESHGGIDAEKTFTPYDLIHFDIDNRWLNGELDMYLSPEGINYVEKSPIRDDALECACFTFGPLIDDILEGLNNLPEGMDNILTYVSEEEINFDAIHELIDYISTNEVPLRIERLAEDLSYRIKETELLMTGMQKEKESVEERS